MDGGIGMASGLVALTALVGRVLILAESLQGISTNCADLVQQLKTLDGVLKYVGQEFNRTIQLAASQQLPSMGFDVTKDLLETCISDCSQTCEQYEVVLRKISTSSSTKLRWLRSEGELARLHLNLEARKSTLHTILVSIRNAGDDYKNNAPPPSYTAATSSSSSMSANNNAGLKVLSGFSTGALGGAGIGAFGGPAGAFVGGIVGGIIGLTTGMIVADSDIQERKRVEARSVALQSVKQAVKVKPKSRWRRDKRPMMSEI